MYASIDLNKLQVLHVHQDQMVVWDLVFLECGDIPWLSVENTEAGNFLSRATPFELRKLYHNLTDHELPQVTIDVMRQAISEVIWRIPATPVNPIELTAQCEYAEKQEEALWRYRKGVKRPEPHTPIAPLKGTAQTEAEFARAPQRAQQRQEAWQGVMAAAATNLAPQPGASGPRATTGSVKPLIWSVADEMWEAAGKPMDKSVVLKLRLEMYKRLENEGVKKNTSSNELAVWMKERLG